MDTMIGGGPGFEQVSQYSSSHHPCPYDAYEHFTCNFYHRMLGGNSSSSFTSHADDKEMIIGDPTGYFVGVFAQNVGDSINYNTKWVKLEAYHPSLSVNSAIYNNVYQMYYYPSVCGFRRLWWCPSVGFVKVESVNATTQQLEDWELTTYTVQVY